MTSLKKNKPKNFKKYAYEIKKLFTAFSSQCDGFLQEKSFFIKFGELKEKFLLANLRDVECLG